MSPEEYFNLERVEKSHWYYHGKREIVRFWIQKYQKIDVNTKLLDCGAGSGAFAAEMSEKVQVTAMDDHLESLEILRRRLPADSIVEGGCGKIPFASDVFEVVTALDVLEHIADDKQAASELVRVLKPHGVFVITVPAMMCLWSDWDVSLHHYRRYDKKSLINIFKGLLITVEHCAYINVAAMPLVWVARKARLLGLSSGIRAEDRVPPTALNTLLRLAFVRLAQTRLQFPFGVGLLLVGRKAE
jgi:SAM-dependent methyltransferase